MVHVGVVRPRPQQTVLPLGAVLDILDAEKGEGAEHGHDDQPLEQFDLFELGCANRPGDGERTEDEYHRVERTERGIEEVGAEDKDLGVVAPIDRVGDEEPTEKEDLGRQKQPHPELGRLALLLGRLEVVGQIRIVAVVVVLRNHQ